MTMRQKDYYGIAKAIGKSFDGSQLSWAKLAENLGTYLEDEQWLNVFYLMNHWLND